MSIYVKLYLRLFSGIGIPSAVIWGLYSALYRHGASSPLADGLTWGICFGGWMSVALGTYHILSVRRRPSGGSREAMGLHHVRNLELPVPYDRAFDLCLDSLTSIRECKIQNEDRSKGRIVARAGTIWPSSRGIISFDVREMDKNRTRLHVSTRPAGRTTLVDYGYNLENVEQISACLNQYSEMGA